MRSRQVVVRPPLLGSALMGLWVLFLESFGIAALVQGDVGGGAFLIVIWWPWAISLLLGLRDLVVIDGEWLTSRGWFRERRWRRDAIRGVSAVRPSWSPNFEYLSLEGTDGRKFLLPGTTGSPWLWDARRRDRQLNVILQWLSEPDAGRSGVPL